MTPDRADSADKDRRKADFLVGFSPRRSQVPDGITLSSLKLRSDSTLLLPEVFRVIWVFFPPVPIPDIDRRGILLLVDDPRRREVVEAFNEGG
jgi:hypothetical protein